MQKAVSSLAMAGVIFWINHALIEDFNIYGHWNWFDRIPHFLMGLLIFRFFFHLLDTHRSLWAFLYTLLIGVGWEFYEFFFRHSQWVGLQNTLQDVRWTLFGALCYFALKHLTGPKNKAPAGC